MLIQQVKGIFTRWTPPADADQSLIFLEKCPRPWDVGNKRSEHAEIFLQGKITPGKEDRTGSYLFGRGTGGREDPGTGIYMVLEEIAAARLFDGIYRSLETRVHLNGPERCITDNKINAHRTHTPARTGNLLGNRNHAIGEAVAEGGN